MHVVREGGATTVAILLSTPRREAAVQEAKKNRLPDVIAKA